MIIQKFAVAVALTLISSASAFAAVPEAFQTNDSEPVSIGQSHGMFNARTTSRHRRSRRRHRRHWHR